MGTTTEIVKNRQRARYDNRELSWMAFNRRVLEEATGAHNPLIERARFLAIVSSNLDEFCMVRFAELIRNRELKDLDPAGLSPHEQLAAVSRELHQLVADQYACWRQQVEPALTEVGFRLVPPTEWSEDDQRSLRALFISQIEPSLTPLAVDPTRPFPLLVNGRIHIVVDLEATADVDGVRPGRHRALVTVPDTNRILALTSDSGGYALAEDVVEACLETLFSGYTLLSRTKFRITRDGDLEIDEDQAVDLLQEMEEELRQRAHGPTVRLEVQANANQNDVAWLIERLELVDESIVTVDGPLDFTMMMGIDGYVNEPGHNFKPFVPNKPAKAWSDPFAAIRKKDQLIHCPFDSFQPVIDLIDRAADDPQVLAIKQTLYRVSGDSPIVRALMRAARADKQVTVIVELKARFDEARNIKWARRLEQAGAHVVYGLVGYKVHAKLLLIIRREDDGIRRYCHIGTGNFNDKTAKLYTDLAMLTANQAVGRDVADLFNMLTGFTVPPDWERLAVSPLTMRSSFVEWIRREAEHAKAGKDGHVIAKFNSLVDTGICDELYAASQAGVKIDLIVRGMCILRAGVVGLSENIRVLSVVGRFLEHSRIFYFANLGDPVYAIASADWMSRNLDRRVEAAVTVTDRQLQQRIHELLEIYLNDNASARLLQSDGTYQRLQPADGEASRASQDILLASLPSQRKRATAAGAKQLVPLKRPR